MLISLLADTSLGFSELNFETWKHGVGILLKLEEKNCTNISFTKL